MKLTETTENPTRQKLLLVALCLVSVWALEHLWYSPKRAKLGQSAAGLAKLETEIKKQEEQLKELSQRTPAQAALARFDSEMLALLEYNNNYTNLIRMLNNNEAIDASRLRINKISVDKQEQISEFTRLDLTLDLTGTFVSVGKFLESLEKSKLLTEVSSINLKRLPGGEVKRCTAIIKLAGYVNRGDSPPPAGKDSGRTLSRPARSRPAAKSKA